jgi:cytochrome P450
MVEETGMQGVCPAHAENVPLPLDQSLPRTTSYEEGVAVLKSAAFSSNIFDENAELLDGTLLGSDGERHRSLKRVEGALFSSGHLEYYEKSILGRVMVEELETAKLGSRNADGAIQVDLIPFVRRMALRISAHVVGLDDVDAEQLTTLTGMLGQLADGILIQWSTRDHAEVMREALQTKREFWDQFVQNALARRHALDAEGKLEKKDLLSVIVADKTLSWSDDEILKESMLYMAAAAFTTSTAVTHSIAELLAWFSEHPEDRALDRDKDFLRVAAMESLRVHPGRHVLIRSCIQDSTMPDGRPVSKGEYVLVDCLKANMDSTAYGDDVESFDPHRVPAKGALPYGLSFGAGRHLCLGKPLVLGTPDGRGSDVRDGTVTLLLSGLFGAGVAADPEQSPVRPDSVHDRYESYPVLLTKL